MLNLIRQLFNFFWRSWLYIIGAVFGFGGFIYNLNSEMVWYYKIIFLVIGIVNLYLIYTAWRVRDDYVAND
jgi:hypothetical protein